MIPVLPLISLLHATRWRPEQALNQRDLWLQRADAPETVEHLFAFDDDDDESRLHLSSYPSVVVSPGGSCVAAWNAAAAASHGGLLIQLSDDWLPPPRWDRSVRERLGDPNLPRVLAVSDGHRRDALLCIAILTRRRYLDQGWMFCPDYSSVWSDNEFTWRAHRDGVIVEARDLIFEHRHPTFHPNVPVDRTYRHQNSAEAHRRGKEIFTARNPDGLAFFPQKSGGTNPAEAAEILSALHHRILHHRKS
jgi:hypothetical protein